MNTSGGQVSSFDPNDPEVRDLAFDGTYLWAINSTGTIKRFTSGGSPVSSKAGLLTHGWGLTWEDGHLWASDPDKAMIYRIGLYEDISPDSLKTWVESGADLLILDVREQHEFESTGRIPGAINMPWNSGVLDTGYAGLSVDDTIIVYCHSGSRSALASTFLGSKGFQHIYNMAGGFSDWHHSVEVGGHVSVNTTWQIDKSPYMAVEDVTIDSSATLVIQAGILVRFGDSHALRVHGTWIAQGAAGDPVIITRGGSAGYFPVVINGTIDVEYVDFEYFDSSGVNIWPTATIERFNYVNLLNDDIPGPNSFLQLTPENDTLRFLTFNGGAFGEDCNITLHGEGTLTVYGHEGDFGGEEHDCPGDGEIVWLQGGNWITEEETQTPDGFEVHQNYPNPFNPRTTLEYTLPNDCRVRVTIYNLLGQRVRQLLDENQMAGHKTLGWNGKDDQGRDAATGIYFYTIRAGDLDESKKMVLLR